MAGESQQGPLPLADAIIQWAEPTLIEAIKIAEAAFAPDQLLVWGRPSLSTIAVRRANPFRIRPARRELVDLDRAWEAVFADWRYRLERGEILLEGIDTFALRQTGPVRIPNQRAAELLFDPAAGAVRLGITTYVGVVVTRVMRAPDTMTGQEGSTLLELPLSDALLEWGNPQSVLLYKAAQARILELQMLAVKPSTGNAHLAPVQTTASRMAETERLRRSMPHLQASLVSDVRRKIECGELAIAGVMTYPRRTEKREPIPGLWAADFFFDVAASRINVVQFGRTTHAYTAVVVAGPGRREASPAAEHDAQDGSAADVERPAAREDDGDPPSSSEAPAPPVATLGDGERETGGEVPAPKRHSRFPWPELIAIARDRLQTRKRLNKDEASVLLAEFVRLHPGRRAPAYREVLDHVRSIYDEAAKATAPRFPLDGP
jgi:hypothetical protein